MQWICWQIGIRHEVRRVVAISNVAKDLKNGDVTLSQFADI